MRKQLIAALPGLALVLTLAAPASLVVPTSAFANSHSAKYCRKRAKQLSHSSGPDSNAVAGAIGGAIGGALLAGVLGGNSTARKQAAGAGAIIGGIAGAQKPNHRASRIYKLEYQACMNSR